MCLSFYYTSYQSINTYAVDNAEISVNKHEINSISLSDCIRAKGIGHWDQDGFHSPYIINNYLQKNSNAAMSRVFLIGDSISREGLSAICRSRNAEVATYMPNCRDERVANGHSHYFCKTNDFEIASFFLYGATLDDEDRKGFGGRENPCVGIPYGAKTRSERYINASKSVFSADPDIVIINTLLWNIEDLKKSGKTLEFFENPNSQFLYFAEQYIQNMSYIYSQTKFHFPNAKIYSKRELKLIRIFLRLSENEAFL